MSDPQEPKDMYFYASRVAEDIQSISENNNNLREWGRHWEEKCKATEAVNEVLRHRITVLESYIHTYVDDERDGHTDPAAEPAEHTVPEKYGLKLFREYCPRGHPEMVKTYDLFVWMPVQQETGQVDMVSIEEFGDELAGLDYAWEWQRFRLVPEPEINTETQDG